MDQKPLYYLANNVDLTDTGRNVEEALGECERELGVRNRCFQSWIDSGKLNRNDARDRMQRMARACQLLSLLNKLPALELLKLEARMDLAIEQKQLLSTKVEELLPAPTEPVPY